MDRDSVVGAVAAATAFALAAGCLLLAGCTEKPSALNSDPSLRKTWAQFAVDASKRTYKADAPSGGQAAARAQVYYQVKYGAVDVLNLSEEDWTDVEVWVNQRYVVFLPKMERKALKRLWFDMLFDNQANYLAISKQMPRVEKVELFRDGKLYSVPVQLAD